METYLRDVRVSLDRIRCIKAGDGLGRAEPYLWAIFIKIGGDELRQDPDDPNFVLGTPAYAFSQGSHGNMVGPGFRAGDERPIPGSVGWFEDQVRPLPLVLGEPIDVPGIMVLITILNEENNLTASGAEAAHQAVNQAVVDEVNHFVVKKLHLGHLVKAYLDSIQEGHEEEVAFESMMDVLEGKLEAVKERIEAKAKKAAGKAVKDEQNLFENLWAAIYRDGKLGQPFFQFTTDELLANDNEMTIKARFNKSRGDFEITGKATLSPPIIPIGTLPAADRLEVDAIAQGHRGQSAVDHITHIGGTHGGKPWIVATKTGAVLVRSGKKSFYVRASDGSETEVIAAKHGVSGKLYLRTSPNKAPGDNLLSLPELSFYLQ